MKEKSRFFCIFLFLFLSVVVTAQTQYKLDTVLCGSKKIIIEYPQITRTQITRYEEGFFKTVNCILDTASITIQCGSMINYPIVELANKTVCTKFILYNDISIIRGYVLNNEKRKYFREDNYKKYGISIVYENVDESALSFYENSFNNLKILW